MYFYGEVGENFTGVSLGGFEISNSKYIVVGNSIMQDENYLNYEIRNIFAATAPRERVWIILLPFLHHIIILQFWIKMVMFGIGDLM